MFSWFYSFKHGIKNIIKWFPIIWNDRDYDEYYIYNILYHKFKSMEKFYLSGDAYSAKATDVAKQLRVVKNLAKRLKEENYLINALMWHEQKYPDFLENICNFEATDNPQIKTWKDLNPEGKKESFNRYDKHSDYMENQDREMLFKLMSKHINEWWD